MTMNRLLAYFGIFIVLAQSALCVPIPVEEPPVDPELRGFIDAILSALSQPIMDGLASTGVSAINSGGNLLSNLMAGLNSNPDVILNSNPELDSEQMIVQQDDQMLDVLDALLDQMILDQPIGTTETINGNSERVSQDESDDVPGTPLYLVVLP
ncbi:uncharacterized protein LOC119074370 [Bradysia coprophila]|uniref:uncharacterized protein LOC119074370 n=1 Tax=Bradysia coprophila TaxID=38358 RepID=UPI00187DB372|nr:uncharacterized protein LOC119074370 [Bradysia coprophila]